MTQFSPCTSILSHSAPRSHHRAAKRRSKAPYPVRSARRYCVDGRARRRHDAHMPLDFTELELETAARACRTLAYQEEQAAKRMKNPSMRGPIENTAKRATALAKQFESARKRDQRTR